jgi:hypothetical protein
MLQLAISIRVSESIFQRGIRHKNTARFLAPWADRNVFQQLLAFEKPRVAVTSVNLAVDSPCHQAVTKWGWVKTNSTPGEHQNSWDLWMFIPLKMVLIGIDGIDP